ncbi:hypothetical protein [Streptomyces aquilus]
MYELAGGDGAELLGAAQSHPGVLVHNGLNVRSPKPGRPGAVWY